MNEISPNKKYGIIYSDPPWPQKKGGIRKCRPKQDRELDYKTMSVEECFLVQDRFFNSTEEQHNIFLWTIDKYLHNAEEQMAKRGYKLHARFVWDKENGVAPAFTVRFSHEYLLWFYKPGKMLMPSKQCRGKYMTVLREPATYHSHKPICAYEMLEDMFPDVQKIELFARNSRIGWDSWGNEAPAKEFERISKEEANGRNST